MFRRHCFLGVCLLMVLACSSCRGAEIKPDESERQRANVDADTEIGEIIITNRDAQRALESDTINLPNCGGNKTLEINRTFAKEAPRQVRLTKTEPSIPVSEGVIVDAVRALFNADEDEVLTGSVDGVHFKFKEKGLGLGAPC